MEPCSIGIFREEDCHQTTFSRTSWLNTINEISETDRSLLIKRTGITIINTICQYHYKKYIDKFYLRFGIKCCDPLKIHKKTITKSLREISLAFCQAHEEMNLIPGLAMCTRCYDLISKTTAAKNDRMMPVSVEETMPVSLDQDPQFEPDCNGIQLVNEVCSILKESPVTSLTKIPLSRRKRKISEKATEIAKSVRRNLMDAFGVDENETNSEETEHIKEDDDSKLGSEYLKLIEELKAKYLISTSFEEKYTILTLLPTNWSIAKIQSEFNCSDHIARKAKKMRELHGVLPKHDNIKSRNKISDETIKAATDFYEDDDISRIMPGQKDCLTVRDKEGNKSKQQKRLVLLNLKEIFIKFKECHPGVKIGFSSFCSLRPKNCILAGASGTHSVCVCLMHQNIKLMLSAIKTKLTYQDLLKSIVCDIYNENCMLSKCKDCPGVENLDSKISEDIELLSSITYSQWSSTDRCHLLTVIKTATEFNEDLKDQLLKMKHHHYITKKQSGYLKNLKENLQNDTECIVLGDFSENFTFMVQDEVQSFHWTNDQATLHPFVSYIKKDNVIHCRTFCVISDCLTHNTVSFFAFQKVLLECLKQEYDKLETIHYFSDGAAAQYKNKKNFVNLCHHYDDFGLKAEWNFFATSHGKSPCDGAGGTIKRLVRKASLQRITGSDNILSPEAMYEFCVNEIHGIKFFFVAKSDVEVAEMYLSE